MSPPTYFTKAVGLFSLSHSNPAALSFSLYYSILRRYAHPCSTPLPLQGLFLWLKSFETQCDKPHNLIAELNHSQLVFVRQQCLTTLQHALTRPKCKSLASARSSGTDVYPILAPKAIIPGSGITHLLYL